MYVNLYIPSTLRWSEGAAQMTLDQTGNYPNDPHVAFTVRSSTPVETALAFRIPEWAAGAALRVNGKRVSSPVTPGRFATVRRTWADGDRVDLELPLLQRVEAVDKQHPNTLALMRGPLVLFPLKPSGSSSSPDVSRGALLGAKATAANEWQVQAKGGTITLVPFTALGEQSYSTYLKTV